MATNTNVALRLAEAFARHAATFTFGQSLPSAFPPGGTAYCYQAGSERADLLLLIGNRTHQSGPDSRKRFPDSAKFVHLNTDPMEVGAQLAAPNRRVVCLCGDGGFAQGWAELVTLRRLDLPIAASVLNNGMRGYQKHAADVTFGGHTDAVEFTAVDHATLQCGGMAR